MHASTCESDLAHKCTAQAAAVLLSSAWGAPATHWNAYEAKDGCSSATLHLALCEPCAAAAAHSLEPHVAVNGRLVSQHPFSELCAALAQRLLQTRQARSAAPAAPDFLLELRSAGSLSLQSEGPGHVRVQLSTDSELPELARLACNAALLAAGCARLPATKAAQTSSALMRTAGVPSASTGETTLSAELLSLFVLRLH